MFEQGTSLKKFNVIEKLGQGSFSCVYKVQRIDDNNYYAMKKVKINQMKQKQKQNALNQIRILASITHPNIVNYKQAFFDEKTQTLCVVMELADAGDIQKKINQHKINKTYYNQVQIWQALIQMTKGLKALHQINILHRDLKCANVFCTKDGKYKLGDLNVSKVAKKGMARTQTGTPYYTSPEVWNDRPYDSKCDIWSLGCVIYQMASLNPPFRASNLKQLYTKIQKGIYPNIPSFYSQDLKYIISQCLKVTPTQRPSAIQLLQNSKVIKNMPSSEAYNQQNNQTSKAALLKTILVPKNMRHLKEALPGSKYDNDDKSIDRKYRRVNSAQNLRSNINVVNNVIPSVINSPKVGDQNNKYNLNYHLLRRPSQQQQQQPKSQIRQRQLSRNNSNSNIRNNISNVSQRGPSVRMHRNNSVDYIRNRVNSRQSQNRNNHINNSRQSDHSRHINHNSNNNNSILQRKRQNSFSKQKVKNCMDDISNRCRQIQQRVKNLMQKKKQSQQQRNPNIPYLIDRKYQQNFIPQKKIISSSRQKQRQRDNSVHSNRSRNNSINRSNSYKNIEQQKVLIRRNQQIDRNNYNRYNNGGRILSRQRSNERLPSVEIRNNSSKKNIPVPVPARNYLYKAPPKFK